VGTLYRAFAAGSPSPLAELPIQFADYAHWQRQWLRGEVLETQLAYWREVLRGVAPLLEVPADRPRPAVQSGRGAEVAIRLPEATAEAVAALARRLSASPFMVVLAAFQLLLGHYAGSDDVVVGAPIAGRQRIETERLIGFFVNLLALRARWGAGSTVRELVTQVRDRTLGAHVHQDLPFERLVEELRLPRDLAYEPLVQAVLSLDVRRPLAAVPGWAVSSLAPEVYAAKFDLHLALESEDGRLSGALGYSRDLFDGTSMRRLLSHFETLLGEVVADPERPLAALGMLQPAERHQLLGEWNDRAAGFATARPVHALVEAAALASPEAIALVHAGETLSYGELVARSRRLARLLRARGVGPEVAVAVCAERSLAWAVGLLAILEAGGAYVPLDPALPAERLAYMLRDCAAPVVLTERRLAARLPAVGAVPLLLDGGWEAAAGEADGLLAAAPVEVTASHLAYVIYTSGSTGRPKGVEVTHGSLLHLIAWHLAAHAVSAADRATQLAGVGFDAAVWELWPYLACGASVYLAAPETTASPELLRNWLVASGITVSFLPTPLAEMVITLPWPATARLRRLLTGGDRLHAGPPAGLPFALFNHYGPTESTVVASWCAVEPAAGSGAAEGLPPIGRPVDDSGLYVLDAGGGVLPLGAAGELFIGGAGVARGYRGAAVATAERFVPDPFARRPGSRLYRTGDRVRYRPDGSLEFLGRLDDQVKIRGFRIELGEIEGTLAAHPAVREAAVAVRETGGDRRLVAFWVASAEVGATAQELRVFLRDRLPEYMVPVGFQRLPALPLTTNGKIDRRALPAGEGDTAAQEAAGAAPRDLLELQLAQLWQEMLGVQAVSVRDSFFDLGGHSLLAVRLIAAIERRYGRQLPLSALFQAPTVEALAALLRDQGGSAPASSLVPLRPGGPLPPLSLVHPVGGHVFAYLPLARRLGAERPLYGFQSHGALPDRAPDATIEAMAERYLDELVAAEPAGPYHLAGWSIGGFVALEMACRLRAAGRRVGLLALLDTNLGVAGSVAPADEADLMTTFVLDRGLPEEQAAACAKELRRAAPADRLARMRALLLREALVPPDLELATLHRLFALFGANFAAARAYRPRFFAGRIDLFAARESLGAQPRPGAGWSRLAAEVAVHSVPGGHFTMLQEPQVQDVAERLASCLAGHGEPESEG
jgi:amino acid adenylation domain-containing protein